MGAPVWMDPAPQQRSLLPRGAWSEGGVDSHGPDGLTSRCLVRMTFCTSRDPRLALLSHGH